MKWVTRARPKTDRIACPWLIRRFIDPDAEILYVPKQDVLDVAGDEQAHSFDAPGAEFDHRDGRCTFEVLIDHFGLDRDPALVRLAAIVHAADIDTELHTDPLGPGLLAIGARWPRRRSRRPPAAGTGLVRLRRPLRLVHPTVRDRVGVTVTLDYDAIRADTVRHVPMTTAAAAITAPKSGGQLFVQGKHLFNRLRRG